MANGLKAMSHILSKIIQDRVSDAFKIIKKKARMDNDVNDFDIYIIDKLEKMRDNG